MPMASVNGIKLYYEVTGSGYPLLFSHEFAGDSRSWEPQVRSFSRRYQVITYNLGQGWGRGCRSLRHGGKLTLHGGNGAFLGFQTCRDRLGALAVHGHSQGSFPTYTAR